MPANQQRPSSNVCRMSAYAGFRVTLLDYSTVDYNDVAAMHDLPAARTFNVAQLAKFAVLADGGAEVVVCNSHLFWNPKMAYIKTLQVRTSPSLVVPSPPRDVDVQGYLRRLRT